MKRVADWIHLVITLLALSFLTDHWLEVLIVLILMYDIGFEYPAVEKLASLNNEFRRWLHAKISKATKFFARKGKKSRGKS